MILDINKVNPNDIYFRGYVLWEDRILVDDEFVGILKAHFLKNELPDRIKEYNGSFMFVIVDGDNIYIGNDRYGLRPLYYYHKNNQFVVSNQWQKLIPYSDQLREDSILEALAFGCVLNDKTLLKDIYELPPASFVHISKSNAKFRCYWKLEYTSDKLYNEKEFAELWSNQIRYYTDFIKRNGNKCTLPLSGGLDSRLLAYEFDKAGIDIHALTYGPDSRYGEIITAKQVAKELNIKTHKIIYCDKKELHKITNSDESYDRITNLKNAEKILYSYRELNNDIRVPGYSGDFLAGSHLRHRMKKWRSKRDIISYILRFHISKLVDSNELVSVLDNSIESDADPVTAYMRWDLKNRQRRYIVRAEIGDNDSLSLLLPFFDYVLMDYFLSLPMSALLNTKLYINAQLRYLYKTNLIKIKRDNFYRQKIIRNNFIYEYYGKLRQLVNRNSVWSRDINWQEEVRAWGIHFNVKNINGTEIMYLFELAKLKKELS